MKKSTQILIISILTVGSFAASSEVGVAASFQGLGTLPGESSRIGPPFSSRAHDISADGSTVVGRSHSANGAEAFIWDKTNGIRSLGDLPGVNYSSSALAVSADGSVVVGEIDNADGQEAFIWDKTNGIRTLGELAKDTHYSPSRATAVSADGSIFIGDSPNGDSYEEGYGAFFWNSTDGIVRLGDLPGHTRYNVPYSEAYGISADGSIVIGDSDSAKGRGEAFIWDRTNGIRGLGDLPGGIFFSRATAISADGSTVVGGSRGANGHEAFIWDSINGMRGLGRIGRRPSGSLVSGASDVSADGSIVVGGSTSSRGYEAFIWDSANGIRSLQDTLTNDFNLDLTGWRLTSAEAISDDGLSIIGWGKNPEGRDEGWIATIDIETSQSVPESQIVWGYLIVGLSMICRQFCSHYN